MKIYAFVAQLFLALALLGWIGWIITRFTGPIHKVSYEGMLTFSLSCLAFATAVSLIKLAFFEKKGA